MSLMCRKMQNIGVKHWYRKEWVKWTIRLISCCKNATVISSAISTKVKDWYGGRGQGQMDFPTVFWSKYLQKNTCIIDHLSWLGYFGEPVYIKNGLIHCALRCTLSFSHCVCHLFCSDFNMALAGGRRSPQWQITKPNWLDEGLSLWGINLPAQAVLSVAFQQPCRQRV